MPFTHFTHSSTINHTKAIATTTASSCVVPDKLKESLRTLERVCLDTHATNDGADAVRSMVMALPTGESSEQRRRRRLHRAQSRLSLVSDRVVDGDGSGEEDGSPKRRTGVAMTPQRFINMQSSLAQDQASGDATER